MAMLESFATDCSCPAICKACGAIYTEDRLEQDAENVECPDCGESQVESVMILAGVM